MRGVCWLTIRKQVAELQEVSKPRTGERADFIAMRDTETSKEGKELTELGERCSEGETAPFALFSLCLAFKVKILFSKHLLNATTYKTLCLLGNK